MNICVVGVGYVGLVTAVCFADKGDRVSCIDIDRARIDLLNDGESPIYEPGIEELIERNMRAERLFFTTDLARGLEGADVCFIATGTPPREDGRTDMTQVYGTAEQIAELLDHSCVIVIKSTVPVGTNAIVKDMINRRLEARKMGFSVDVASNPEFLKEGSAIEDCHCPSRVVIGASLPETEELLRELYMPFADESKILFMDPVSAEITKYAANAMLATRISFMNEIARFCDKVGANVDNVKRGIATDERIGPHFLNSGCGYGGSCFPKDIKSLCWSGLDFDMEMTILAAVEAVNDRQKTLLCEMLKRHFRDLSHKRIAVLGLSFKPNTDDMRDAPSIHLINFLLEEEAEIVAYDPIAADQAKKLWPRGVTYAGSVEDAVADADAAVLVTEWKVFKEIDWERTGALMKTKVLLDGRNIYSPEKIKSHGFTYYCIGRGHSIF